MLLDTPCLLVRFVQLIKQTISGLDRCSRLRSDPGVNVTPHVANKHNPRTQRRSGW
jgi:hypothetical protein